MDTQNEKVEYGKTEIKEKQHGLNEVKVVKEGVTQDDSLTKKKYIKKEEGYKKADAVRE